MAAQEADSGLNFGVTVGYAVNGTQAFDLDGMGDLDVGVMASIDDLIINLSYIFDFDGGDAFMDYGFRATVGNQMTDKWSFYGSVIYNQMDEFFEDQSEWAYGVDVGYAITEKVHLLVGTETIRGVRVGTQYRF